MTDGFNECSVYCTIVYIYIYVCVCLVGSLEHFLFFHILGIIIPTDYFFQRGWNHQPGVCVCVVLFHPSYLVWWSQKTCSCSCSCSCSLSLSRAYVDHIFPSPGSHWRTRLRKASHQWTPPETSATGMVFHKANSFMGWWELITFNNPFPQLSSGYAGSKKERAFIFPIEFGAKELLRVSQPHSNKLQ